MTKIEIYLKIENQNSIIDSIQKELILIKNSSSNSIQGLHIRLLIAQKELKKLRTLLL